MSSSSHVLYRFYSATGQLLYVGITMNPPRRFKSHRDSKDWWGLVTGITVESYRDRKELEQAERRAIKVERPRYNIVHNKRPKPTPTTPTTCMWFKPIWYGTAREAGRTRRLPMAIGERPHPDDDVDAQGRVRVTWAPRPDDWIETVERFQSRGLSNSQIEHFVRATMASDLHADDLWDSFCRQCMRAINNLEVDA